VIVDQDGVYIGEEASFVTTFDSFFKQHAETLKPDYVIVCGTDLARFGDMIKVYDSVQRAFPNTSTMGTRSFVIGTRFNAIVVHEHPWEYEF
jgi:hypothetical protein